VDRFTHGTFLGDYRVFQQRRACQLWPRTTLPRSFYEPVASDIPVLFIAGGLDPVTPPEWSDEIARTLPNSKVVRVPHDAHVPVGINFECMDRLIVQFLDQGNAKGLNFSPCAEQIMPPPFQIAPRETAGAAN
jgi:pimeloyl-ACP methyl ester carboxylesterase